MKSLLVGLGNKFHCYLATRPEVESLRVQIFVASKAVPSREEPDIILSIVNRPFTCFVPTHYVRNISPKHGSVLNTHNDFICSILNV